MQNYITESTKKIAKKSTKKALIGKISNDLLVLEFKSTNSIQTSLLERIVKHLLPKYKK